MDRTAARNGCGRPAAPLADSRLTLPSLSQTRWFALGLFAIFVVAFGLRLAGTGERTMFWDEAYHARLIADSSWSGLLDGILANPPGDPLYGLLLRAWSIVAGTTDFALRLPSVFFGALTSVAAAWLALELTRSRNVALLSGLLVALAPYAVEYGQEASLYALASLLTTLCLATGWRWRRSGRTSDGLLAIAIAVLAVYSHYVVPVVLGLAALLSLTRFAGPRQVSGAQVAAAGGVVLLAWLPWLVPLLVAWLGAEYPRTALSHAASPAELLGALSQYASGTGALLGGVRPLQVLGVAAAGFLFVRGWRAGRDPALGGLRVIGIVAATAFIGPWLASNLTGRWLFIPHMLLFVLPAVAVVIAVGAVAPGAATRASTRLARRAAPLAWVARIGAQVGGLYVNTVDPPHGNDGSRDLAQVLVAAARPGDPVLILPNEQQIVFERYWTGALEGLPTDIDMRRLYAPQGSEADLQSRITRFEELSGNAPQTWLIYTPAREVDARFLDWLRGERRVELVAERPFGQLYRISR